MIGISVSCDLFRTPAAWLDIGKLFHCALDGCFQCCTALMLDVGMSKQLERVCIDRLAAYRELA
ncbi:MAG: hypothetical protein DCC69_14970 [Hyphomicrobiales bacterium]|nr:MAG: hypothetical protein DCC69_14970 [Hyphomicrobiales bacterium]